MAQVAPLEYPSTVEAASRRSRWAFVAAGHLFVALGVVGAFLPVMPTTVFLILAASCYARGSARFHQKLRGHPTFGPVVRDWEEHRAMSRRAKTIAVSMIVVSFGFALFFIPLTWIRVLHVAIGVALVAFILRIRTR
ncbi:MAG: YbaN family protein [Gemmatimonadales bacterium]|nr:YbaN family protein [Gemmatimonadales bacterium]MDX2061386.1 YbaN family protein [Gemmatimonadales bacterium]